MHTHPDRYVLMGDGQLTATLSAQGAALVGLRFQGTKGPLELVLDPDNADYDRHEDACYIGPIVGRVCGRIRDSRYTASSGEVIRLTANQGAHHLHGGGAGALHRQVWTKTRQTPAPNPSLTLTYLSPAGSEGYPGTLRTEATYTLSGNTLTLQLTAICDAPCPINLTAHPYFNLSGDPSCPATRQNLQMAATSVFDLDDALVPTGSLSSVSGTKHDFNAASMIGDRGLDAIFALEGKPGQPAARLHSPDSGLSLEIRTDQPALVAYDGAHLPSPFTALGGGICLEPQGPPLACRGNRLEWPANTQWTSTIHYSVDEVIA